MKSLNLAIIDKLREMARTEDSVPQMLRAVIRELAPETPHELTLALYLREAFGLTLTQIKPIGAWSADGTGELSDLQLNEFILPEIIKNRHEWDGLVRM